MTKIIKYIIGALIIFLLILAFYCGFRLYPKIYPCPEINTDTIMIYDTIVHYIPDTVPWYIVKKDTVVITRTEFKDVDTAAILRDYYAMHYYTRTWQDSIVQITSEDAIAENRFIDNKFSYKLLRAQTIINNTVNQYSYSKYLYGGVSIPVTDPRSLSIDVIAAFPKMYVGAGYSPGLNSVSVKAGVKLFQLRN